MPVLLSGTALEQMAGMTAIITTAKDAADGAAGAAHLSARAQTKND
jgi:hypothetical protein